MERNFLWYLTGSILGLRVFNVFLCDLFYFLKDLVVSSYTDDTTLDSANKINNIVIKK